MSLACHFFSATFCLVIFGVVSAQGETICNWPVAYLNATSFECVCQDANKIYDYFSDSCIEEIDLYNQETTDFCGLNCQIDGNDTTCSSGWTRNSTTNECTVPDDKMCESLPSSPCSDVTTDCHNTPGIGPGYYCACKEFSYRTSDGKCSTLDYTVNAAWTTDCPYQAVNKGASGYECRCFSDELVCFVDVSGNGTVCELDDSKCQVIGGGEDENFIVVQETSSGKNETYVRSGFVVEDGNETAIDKNECEDNSAICWDGSTCINLPDGQGYRCDCDEGHEELEVNQIAECMPKYCLTGSMYDCTDDPCLGSGGVDQNPVCVARGSFSYELVENKLVSVVEYSGASVYQTQYSVKNGPIHGSLLTKSLDSILGFGVTQSFSNDSVVFDVLILSKTERLANMTLDDIKKLLSDSCRNVTTGDFCILPLGIAVTEVYPPQLPNTTACASNLVQCGNDNYICEDISNEGYQCTCELGKTGTFYDAYREKCTYETDLKADKEYFQNVTIGLSVTLLLVCLGVIGGGLYAFIMLRNQDEMKNV